MNKLKGKKKSTGLRERCKANIPIFISVKDFLEISELNLKLSLSPVGLQATQIPWRQCRTLDRAKCALFTLLGTRKNSNQFWIVMIFFLYTIMPFILISEILLWQREDTGARHYWHIWISFALNPTYRLIQYQD